jgi:hypothetical protein
MKLLTLLAISAAPVVGAGLASLAGIEVGATGAAGNPSASTDAKQSKVALVSGLDPVDRIARTVGPPRGDPFFSTPRPAPPPVVVVAPPPIVPPAPPPAPPFPYRFVGRVIGPVGEPVVYLANGERLLTVRGKGDLGDGYRVDEVSDRHVVITHGASQQKNVIEFGAESDSQRAP